MAELIKQRTLPLWNGNARREAVSRYAADLRIHQAPAWCTGSNVMLWKMYQSIMLCFLSYYIQQTSQKWNNCLYNITEQLIYNKRVS